MDVREAAQEIWSPEIAFEEDDTEHAHLKNYLSSDLSLTKESPPQKLQCFRNVHSNNEAVASKTEKIQKDEASKSSLLVSQKEQRSSSVQAGLQPENSVIPLGQTGSTNMTEGSSQSVSTALHWSNTTHLLSPTTAVPPRDEKPKSNNDQATIISENMCHEDGSPLQRSTQPTTDAHDNQGTFTTQRVPVSEQSGAFFKVPTTVLPQRILTDEGHQNRKPSSRVSAGAFGDQENPQKANLHQGTCFS